MAIIIALAGIMACSVSAFTSRTEPKPWIRRAWWVSFFLAIALIIFQSVDSELGGRSVKSLQVKLADVELYSRVAVLNVRGSRSISRDYSAPDAYTGWSDEYTKRDSGEFAIRLDDDALAHYREMVSRDPLYPFGHYFLAQALALRKDPRWIDHAATATKIFEKTTAIPNHSPDHDDALRNLRLMSKNAAERAP